MSVSSTSAPSTSQLSALRDLKTRAVSEAFGQAFGTAAGEEATQWSGISNSKDNVWGTIDLGSNGKVTIYNGGVTQIDGVDGPAMQDIDWENLNTAEERTEAILQLYGGALQMADTAMSEEAYNAKFTAFWSDVLADDALFERLFAQSAETVSNGALEALASAPGENADAA